MCLFINQTTTNSNTNTTTSTTTTIIITIPKILHFILGTFQNKKRFLKLSMRVDSLKRRVLRWDLKLETKVNIEDYCQKKVPDVGATATVKHTEARVVKWTEEEDLRASA